MRYYYFKLLNKIIKIINLVALLFFC